MPRNRKLAAALAADGRKQYVIAAAVGVAPSTLANVVAGRQAISPHQQQRIADELQVDVTVLFGRRRLVVAA